MGNAFEAEGVAIGRVDETFAFMELDVFPELGRVSAGKIDRLGELPFGP
jgi:hypothetical protein